MRFWLVFAVAMSLLLMPTATLAKNVVAVGYGTTEAEAENDALRKAVEDTVGVMVDSETLVKDSVYISDNIYTKSRGFINEYTVRDRQYTMGAYQVTIEAVVDDTPNSKLMSELTRLGIIDNRLRNPKIAVYIPESHIQYRIPDPAGETAVVKSLLEAGFTNVIEASPNITVNVSSAGWYVRPMTANLAEIQSAARFFNADILIIGEAFSEGVGDVAAFLPGHQRNTGMKSCRARVEAKMYVSKTGQIIAADGTHGSAVDISEAVAAKKALAVAGKSMGEYMVTQLMNNGSGNRQSMEVVVIGTDFSKINRLQTALGKVRGVKDLNMSSYSSGRGVFSMHYGGSPQTLFRELQEAADVDLELQEAAYNTLTVLIR